MVARGACQVNLRAGNRLLTYVTKILCNVRALIVGTYLLTSHGKQKDYSKKRD